VAAAGVGTRCAAGLDRVRSVPVERGIPALRATRLTLTGLLSLVNDWSATWLVLGLVHGRAELDAGSLLGTGAAIWLTNIIASGLWYWQSDRGGPAA
jgi:hypothetical protein